MVSGRREQVVACNLRMFNVGFGDCFLLSLDYRSGKRWHVLIDFGTARRAPDAPTQVDIAREIASVIGQDPWIIVATHRHKDHISGFSGPAWKVLEKLRGQVRRVVQPWTEEPGLAGDAKAPRRASHKAFVQALAAGHAEAGDIRRLVRRDRTELASSIADEIEFVADDNLTNRAAIENLASFGDRCRYISAGERRAFQILPGVTVDVLGPPTVKQWDAIRRQAQQHEEFWHLRASAHDPRKRDARGRPRLARRDRSDAPSPATTWFLNRVKQALGHELLAIVRALDDAMNNTSLILLLKIGRAKLLFPGDAQIENWSFALASRNVLRSLRGVTFYKVGHHGSLNATPRSLWKAFANRRDLRGRKTLPLEAGLSSLGGVHGSSARYTEVPRRTLVEALEQGAVLHRTDAPPRRDERGRNKRDKRVFELIPIPIAPPNKRSRRRK